MALCDFYALREDLQRLFRFLYAETDIIAYEMYSLLGHEPRRFCSLVDVESTFTLGSHEVVHLQLWSPAVCASPVVRRIVVQQPALTYRYTVEGPGLIQLYLDGIEDGVIYHTHFGHWNEAGARQRSAYPEHDCNWHALARLSRKIQHHIKRKLATARVYARPVLEQALKAVDQGNGLSFNSVVHHADSSAIQRGLQRVLG